MTSITALHLYYPENLKQVLRKLQPILEVCQALWISSSSPKLKEIAESLEGILDLPVRTFNVPNTWHDWSGFLEFMQAYEQGTRLIIANDSILTRRMLSKRSILTVFDASYGRSRALVGEVDFNTVSVMLDGQSSACWISTYLFILSGITIDVRNLERRVEVDVAEIMNSPGHFFNHYLNQRRPTLARHPEELHAKLGAMCFERYLTRIAMEQGADIVNAFAGNRLRKLERLLERFKDV